LLLELETLCDAAANAFQAAIIHFVNHAADGRFTTFYPLHALRVSLITAYAWREDSHADPFKMHRRSRATHYTLYYTKAGITYITEKMEELRSG